MTWYLASVGVSFFTIEKPLVVNSATTQPLQLVEGFHGVLFTFNCLLLAGGMLL